jgi:hypothetical protein
MPIQSPQPHDTQAIVVIVLIVAGICVRYWRTALLLFVITLVALVVLGVIAELHAVQHVIR